MTNATLETASRLVAWRINSLDKIIGSKLISKEFMIGKWYWLLEYYKNDETIYLILTPKDSQSLPCPIASFNVHLFCSKSITARKGAVRDVEYPYGKYGIKIDMSTLHVTVPFTFCLEFLDLKMEHGNDGKLYSIWNEEFPGQSTSNEAISRMLSESIYTDIVINARDGSIGAHRAVLAANSPVFKTMFSKSYMEKETSTVNINDLSIGACRAMLNFVYGKRKCNELRAHNEELILAADKYDIMDFKMECEINLCEDVGAKNVFERLICAAKYDLPELKRTCLFYLVKMGMIFELREDYYSFIREADPELVVIVSGACLDAWEAS